MSPDNHFFSGAAIINSIPLPAPLKNRSVGRLLLLSIFYFLLLTHGLAVPWSVALGVAAVGKFGKRQKPRLVEFIQQGEA